MVKKIITWILTATTIKSRGRKTGKNKTSFIGNDVENLHIFFVKK